MRRLWLPLLVLAFVAFHLWTLNYPYLSGDEAMNAVMAAEQFKGLISGHGIELNPVREYLGPADTVLLGIPYLLTNALKIGAYPTAALLRIVPIILYALGVFCVFIELRRRSRDWAWIYCLLAVGIPQNWVNARIGWSPALILGPLCWLWAEALHARRTGRVRLGRVGVVCAIGLQFHPTFGFGALGFFAAEAPLVLAEFRLRFRASLAKTLLGLVIAYPVLRGYPPPANVPFVPGQHLYRELGAMIDILGGSRPLITSIGSDPFARAVSSILGLILAGTLLARAFTLIRPGDRDRLTLSDRDLRRWWIGQSIPTVFTILSCLHSRSLTFSGYERYLLALSPGWTLLLSEAVFTLFQRRGRSAEGVAAVTVYFGLGFVRAALCLLPLVHQPDPLVAEAEYFDHTCSPATCVAYAENFWDYWTTRYYTRDRLALNCYGFNWKPVAEFPTQGRQMESCWTANTAIPFAEPSLEVIRYPAGNNYAGRVCAAGKLQLKRR